MKSVNTSYNKYGVVEVVSLSNPSVNGLLRLQLVKGSSKPAFLSVEVVKESSKVNGLLCLQLVKESSKTYSMGCVTVKLGFYALRDDRQLSIFYPRPKLLTPYSG